MAKVSREDVNKLLDNCATPMFSSRETTDEAFEYAMSLARASGMATAIMATAVAVYHNTLVGVIKEKVNGLQIS